MESVTNERGKTYGNARRQWGMAQELKQSVRGEFNWGGKDVVTKEAIEMILLKISRIITGDELHEDNWVDIEGYARIARESLKCK